MRPNKKWMCNVCGDVFATDGCIEDDAGMHTLERHMDYKELGVDEE